MNCENAKTKLTDLLLDPASVPQPVSTHVASCVPCTVELNALRSTMALLDEWTAPDPTPYFDTRLSAQLREIQDQAPVGWWANFKSSLLYSSNLRVRPIAVSVLSLAMVVGGATFLGTNSEENSQQHAIQASAIVSDLQTLDRNEQVFEQLAFFDQDLDSGDTQP